MEDIDIDESLEEPLDSIDDYVQLTLVFDGVNDSDKMGRAMLCDRQNSVNEELEAERETLQPEVPDSVILAGLHGDQQALCRNVHSNSRVDAGGALEDSSDINGHSDLNSATDKRNSRTLRKETDFPKAVRSDNDNSSFSNDKNRPNLNRQCGFEPVTEEDMDSKFEDGVRRNMLNERQKYNRTNDSYVKDCSHRKTQGQRSAKVHQSNKIPLTVSTCYTSVNTAQNHNLTQNGRPKNDQKYTNCRYVQCPTENRSSPHIQSDPNCAKRLSQHDCKDSLNLEKSRTKTETTNGARTCSDQFVVDIGNVGQTNQGSSSDFHTTKGDTSSCCLQYLVAVVVLVLCAGGSVGIYFAASHTTKEHVADEDGRIRLAVPGAVKHYVGEEVFGRYTIDMQRLENSQELRFIKRDDIENSGVIPADNDSCVYVTSDGMYKIESQVTFKFSPQLPGPNALHAIVLKTGADETERTQVKRPILAGKQNLEGRETILQASNINVLSYLKADEQICVRVNPISNVYNSRIDNILDIEKRFDISSDE